MNKYKVTLKDVRWIEIEVEAKSSRTAEKIAKAKFTMNDLPAYEETVPELESITIEKIQE